MKRIFLDGRTDPATVSHWMGSIYGSQKNETKINDDDYGPQNNSDDSNSSGRGSGRAYNDEMRFIEVWDYVGGTSFRGFVADKELARGKIEKTLFLFFEQVAGTQLKHGYVEHLPLHGGSPR